MTQSVIQVHDLGKRYELNRKDFWALRHIDFEARQGEVIGVVGRNGAGKTTLLRVLGRITQPNEGRAIIRGRVGTLLETGTGFHDDLTGRENVYLNGAILGMRTAEIKRRFAEIVEFSGVGKFIDSRVKSYSSGMRSRLAFAVAAHLDTEVLLVDEILAVGDLAFQEKCLAKMNQLTQSGDRTILFVSHSMGAVQSLCSRAILIEKSTVMEDGSVGHVTAAYFRLMTGNHSGDALARHEGRPGSGDVRITGLRLQDLNGNAIESVAAGSGVRLLFDYQSFLTASAKDVQLGLVFVGSKGLRLFGAPTEVVRAQLGPLDSRGSFVCTLPRLPLLPGQYDLAVSVLVDRNLADKLVNACQISVLDSDFFHTGRLQQNNYGDVLVDYAWHHETGTGDPTKTISGGPTLEV